MLFKLKKFNNICSNIYDISLNITEKLNRTISGLFAEVNLFYAFLHKFYC